MPGPGMARDRPARGGTPIAGPAAVQLLEGLDGWRRRISRRRGAVAARRWSLITLGAALAGVAVGRLDGAMLVTAVAATAVPLLAGAISVARRRRVCAEDAARHLDAAFGFDEQVATALCCAAAGSAVAGRATDHDRLVAELIERAAALVAQTGGVAEPRPAPAYGEWAAMAVTAAAVAAIAAVPGSHPAGLAHAADGPGRAGPLAGAAAAPSPVHAGGAIPGKTGTPGARAASGRVSASAARGARSAASAEGAPTAPAKGSAQASPAKAGGQAFPAKGGERTSPAEGGGQTSPAEGGAPASPGTAGTGAAAGRPAGPSAGGSGQRGPTRSAAGQSPTAQSPTAQSPTAQSPTTRAAMTRYGAAQSATARHAPGVPGAHGAPGSAAHGGAPGGGDAAGTEPGNDRASASPLARLLTGTGNGVLLIVLPGGDGTVAAPAGQGLPGQQPEGGGGSSTAAGTATAPGNGAEYVPPDQNEVPFPDQGLLGRYF